MKYMGIGVAVFVNDEFDPDYSKGLFMGTQGTNNIAEWEALKKSLDIVLLLSKVHEDARFTIYGDSQLVVRQFNGVYRIRKPHLAPYFRECRLVALQIPEKVLEGVIWIPREKNTEADKLSKAGITNFLKTL